MFKWSFVTSLAVFTTMVISLNWGQNNFYLSSRILKALGFDVNSSMTGMYIIWVGVALASYLVFHVMKRVFCKVILDYSRFAGQVWGLTGGYSVIFLFTAFYSDGLSGLFLTAYLFMIYSLIGMLWLIECLVRRFFTKSPSA